MTVSKIYLVTRNSRDKVQVVIAELEQNGNSFTIKRTTGQYKGKMTEQPELLIEKGKVKRSVLQQAELEYNSIVKKYQDKGYKRLDSLTNKKFDDLTESEINTLVPTIKSDTSGNLKPMLAKSSDACQVSVLNKPMLCSKKLNGVRCMFKLNDNNEIISISRGGKNYDGATEHIKEKLQSIFDSYPDIILDGELYHHGLHLQEISGIARLQEWEPRCEKLQYWIYDIADGETSFEDRSILLEKLQEYIDEQDLTINILEHVLTNSWDEIQTLHNRWVSEGFEGLVARKPDKTYQFGKRGSDMIKVKEYKDAEFEIVDYKDGLREEDFCFVLQTNEGKLFSAKPVGDRELKAEYLRDIDNIIGKMGTVKYFEISQDGIPQQPIFQAVRID